MREGALRWEPRANRRRQELFRAWRDLAMRCGRAERQAVTLRRLDGDAGARAPQTAIDEIVVPRILGAVAPSHARGDRPRVERIQRADIAAGITHRGQRFTVAAEILLH